MENFNFEMMSFNCAFQPNKIHMAGQALVFFLCQSLFNSCTTTKFTHEIIQGTYIQEQNNNVQLYFTGSTFSFVDPENWHMARFTCCDTITKGDFTQEGNLIVLNTPQFNGLDSLSLNVKEANNERRDSIYFKISNPIETHDNIESGAGREIGYSIDIKGKAYTNLDRSIVRKYHSRNIQIPNSGKIAIHSIRIKIFATEDYGGRYRSIESAYTKTYLVVNKKSNEFTIDIPELKHSFLSYLRLSRDFIRIINEKKLEWNGKFYIKKN